MSTQICACTKRQWITKLCCQSFEEFTAATNAVCSTTEPVGTRLGWSTLSLAVWVGCGREAQCDRDLKRTGQRLLTAHATRVAEVVVWLRVTS